jgi:hypothetical protein
MSKGPALNDFVAQMQKGLARTNRFFVAMPSDTPDKMIGMFCESTQLPASTMLTAPSKVFGEVREVAYERQFEPINMTFYVDSDFHVKEYFDKWHESIINPYTRAGNYYENYVKPIEIWVHNTEDKRTYAVALSECYPKSVSAVQLDYGSKEIMKLQVTMQYRNWKAVAGAAAASEAALANINNPPVIPGMGAGDPFQAIDLNMIVGDAMTTMFADSGLQGYVNDFKGFQNQFNSTVNSYKDQATAYKSKAQSVVKDKVGSYLGGLFG